jgi:hypothetical protein
MPWPASCQSATIAYRRHTSVLEIENLIVSLCTFLVGHIPRVQKRPGGTELELAKPSTFGIFFLERNLPRDVLCKETKSILTVGRGPFFIISIQFAGYSPWEAWDRHA